MPDFLWFWVWLILAAALYIGEMLTVTFFLLPFGIGATVAFLANLFGLDLWLQWVLFVVVSLLALVLLRPLVKRLTAGAEKTKSGVDRLIGMTGHIIEGSTSSGENRARVEREVWNVTTETGTRLAIDTPVKVLRVEGVHLIVEEVPR
ncbi:MAG: NfeD family protein [Coriobacteriales bacterium]|jgi:membrane protein implicated in regulation of membrane protease activity|nr:NfeD family protein [Coriobacteriales bacterium]